VRLGPETVARLPAEVARFSYDRRDQRIGIVHFGLGAFHRAHQAWYTDRAMDAGDRDWAICGVSLRSGAVAERLNPQQGIYSLTERSGTAAATRVIGAVGEVLIAPRQARAVVDRLASPDCRIVTFTVTEKGYAIGPEGRLDGEAAEASFYPLLAEGLARRMTAGLAGVTLISCDNLAGNGRKLTALTQEYLERRDPRLAEWFADRCACPSTMVDRIVPATSDADRDLAERRLGLRDEAAVVSERFSQWVIEDRFAGPRPGWEAHGVQLVGDAEPYETAKLRLLNGAHSALAYLGLERGYRYVHEAIAGPAERALVERLMRDEAATSFTPATDQDLAAYADALIERFADPAVEHRLAQIAIDGSQKIPQRWLPVLAHHQRRGRACPATLRALAAWTRHVRGDGHPVDDPLAGTLAEAWREAGERNIAAALFGPRGLFAAHWQADEEALTMLSAEIARQPT